MPIKVPDDLPGRIVLEQEHVPLIMEQQALRQDIRPLQVAILNLMPDKTTTETQLLRAIGLSPLQIEITLLHMSSHHSKNTPQSHLTNFYKTYADVKGQNFDALVVTGAPVDHLEYEDVNYWPELTEILDWARTHVYSSLFICWGALAGLYHYNGVKKTNLTKKISGIYSHKIVLPFTSLVGGFDDVFDVPVSRLTGLDAAEIAGRPGLDIVATSPEAGIFIVSDESERRVYLLNHLEYDAETILKEYRRDLAAGLNPDIPYNYFPGDNPQAAPSITWRAHRALLFTNWINSVYQGTPYDLSTLSRNKA